jgi:Tol biopolymer transport system component
MPRWSPDGKWIAFNGWQSRERPWTLRIVDPVTGDVRQIDAIDHIEDYEWSPDGKKLGFTAMRTQPFRWEIGWVDVPEGTAHIAGIDEGPGEYGQFAWAPDGLEFVVNRYVEDEHDDSVRSSDFWLYDLKGHRCRLTNTPKIDEEGVGWIDDRSIRFTLLDWNTPADTVVSIHQVIELPPR